MEEQGLTYWSCLTALDTLSSSLLTSRGYSPNDIGKLKNFFGSYQDPPLKALEALIKLYRKQNLFLAEGARTLIQAVAYDIPQLKKLIQTNTKQNEDLLRKVSDEQRSSRELRLRLFKQLEENWKIKLIQQQQNLNMLTNEYLIRQLKKRAEEDVPELINQVITKAKESDTHTHTHLGRETIAMCVRR